MVEKQDNSASVDAKKDYGEVLYAQVDLAKKYAKASNGVVDQRDNTSSVQHAKYAARNGKREPHEDSKGTNPGPLKIACSDSEGGKREQGSNVGNVPEPVYYAVEFWERRDHESETDSD